MMHVYEQSGRLSLQMTAQPMGRDVHVCLSGGDSPHIGAVAVALPCPSLNGDGSLSTSASVITLPGHKEDELARRVAVRMAAALGVTVSVTCGIHLDAITLEEIETARTLTDSLTERLLIEFRQQKTDKPYVTATGAAPTQTPSTPATGTG